MSSDDYIPVDQVIITNELTRRPSRPPDYERESRALAGLMEALANQPGDENQESTSAIVVNVLQQMTETALELCQAQSAGISLCEQKDGRKYFRWRAVSGQLSIYRDETMPWESPCGTVLERLTPLLMAHPERHYAFCRAVSLPVAEALLIPLRAGDDLVGTIWIISHDGSRQFDAEDCRLLSAFARLGATFCQFLNREEKLASELRATQRLQDLSTELVVEAKPEALYAKIVEAAALIMNSDFASMQLKEERGQDGGLRLLAYKGFNQRAAEFWKWVPSSATTSCAAAVREGKRVICADVESEPSIASDHLATHRDAGIRSMQTTPLVSRNGQVLGMLSTHWAQVHEPTERDLRLFDLLARQAADLIERSLAEERTQLLLREISHRAKNILAVVQGIARQSSVEGNPEIFAEQLAGRLAGLAASQNLLTEGNHRGVELDMLVRAQIAHLHGLSGTRIELAGSPVRLTAAAAQTIGMALHELGTNAVKYGALSSDKGIVTVSWNVKAEAGGSRFLMSWRERDGPPPSEPKRRGFGYSVLVRMVEHALDAEVALDYSSGGLVWQLEAPYSAVAEHPIETSIRAMRVNDYESAHCRG